MRTKYGGDPERRDLTRRGDAQQISAARSKELLGDKDCERRADGSPNEPVHGVTVPHEEEVRVVAGP